MHYLPTFILAAAGLVAAGPPSHGAQGWSAGSAPKGMPIYEPAAHPGPPAGPAIPYWPAEPSHPAWPSAAPAAPPAPAESPKPSTTAAAPPPPPPPATTSAAPTPLPPGYYTAAPYTNGSYCLTDADATALANDFAQLISNYTVDLANAVLDPAYTDQSDSIITLIDSGMTSPIPLGALTFANRTEFEQGQGAQPPIPFKILNQFHNCETIIIRWLSALTPQQVQGITILNTAAVEEAGRAQRLVIRSAFAEFNSGAWLADLGRPECNATAAPAARR